MICPQEHIVTSSSGQSSSRSFRLRFISKLSGFWRCAVSILLISRSDLDVLGWRISLSFLLVMMCFVDFFMNLWIQPEETSEMRSRHVLGNDL